jgi:hypothetical protein
MVLLRVILCVCMYVCSCMVTVKGLMCLFFSYSYTHKYAYVYIYTHMHTHTHTQVLTSYGQAMYGTPQAGELFQRALDIDPSNAVAACGMGDYLSEGGDPEGAFERILYMHLLCVYELVKVEYSLIVHRVAWATTCWKVATLRVRIKEYCICCVCEFAKVEYSLIVQRVALATRGDSEGAYKRILYMHSL